MTNEQKTSLYEQIGGETAIQAAVGVFYKKILLDERVSGFFEHTNMKRLYKHQQSFLSYALGGPNNYEGRDLTEAHRNLVENRGLNEDHFNIVAEHLLETLIELGVPSETRQEIMTIVGGTKGLIFNQE